MSKSIARVVINGYGVIGKRVADAVAKQPDMRVIGVSDIVGDYRVKMAAAKGYEVYASIPERVEEMRKAGLE
ncbi:MAG: glyceraldehyde 3-phosphate dehydrogenase NAD-binding domain-containing protein, partial [Conexivisphaera sp.]